MEQDVFTTNTVVEALIPAFIQPEKARKRAAIYARVSTVKKQQRAGDAAHEDDAKSFEQRPEVQIEALKALAAEKHVPFYEISSVTGQGIEDLKYNMAQFLSRTVEELT